MVVLQFGFDGRRPEASPHHPANHREDSVCYVGTHDNDTARGWWEGQPGPVRGPHRLDHVVDQPLERLRSQLIDCDLARSLAQHRMPDLDDLARAHASCSCIGMRTPRSSATSIARS